MKCWPRVRLIFARLIFARLISTRLIFGSLDFGSLVLFVRLVLSRLIFDRLISVGLIFCSLDFRSFDFVRLAFTRLFFVRLIFARSNIAFLILARLTLARLIFARLFCRIAFSNVVRWYSWDLLFRNDFPYLSTICLDSNNVESWCSQSVFQCFDFTISFDFDSLDFCVSIRNCPPRVMRCGDWWPKMVDPSIRNSNPFVIAIRHSHASKDSVATGGRK